MRAWIEINMDALNYNIDKIKELSGGREVICVIKANGYGLGAVEIAKGLLNHGVKMFGVATFEEGLELRQNGIKCEILVLGSLFDDEIKESSKEGFHVSICSADQLHYIAANKLNTKVHLKVDTGMGRVGFLPEEVDKVYQYCMDNDINVTGIYSHLSSADDDAEGAYDFTMKQLEIFKKFEKLKLKYMHIFNSGAVVRYESKIIGNAVRPGLCMYGMLGNERISGFKSVFEMKGRVLYKRTVKGETPISYGRTATLENGETFVTLSVGYADGLKREFSNKMFVIIHGHKCQLIGNICMDMCMAKVPKDIVDMVNIGDEAIIYNDEIIKDIKSNTKCSWEILTGIGRRVYRVYIKDDKVYKTTRWISEK